jgi:hypothetical protein
MKWDYKRRCGHDGTCCVAIASNSAEVPWISDSEILIRNAFNLSLWIRPGLINIERWQINYVQSLAGAIELGKE